jgi:hypothetical protein
MPQPVRSVLAVLAGFLAMMIVVIVLTFACIAFFHLQSGHPTPLYLAINMVYSLVAALLGGWITGRLAGRAPVAHGVALAILMLAMGMMSLLHPAAGQSMLYLVFLATAPPLVAIAGSILSLRTR